MKMVGLSGNVGAYFLAYLTFISHTSKGV